MSDAGLSGAAEAHVTAPSAIPRDKELLQVWRFYRRWWVWVSLVTVLTVCSTIGYLSMSGAKYDVTAALYYKMGVELAPPPTIGNEPILITRRKEDVHSEMEILSSPHLVDKVIQELGEEFFRSPPPTTWVGRAKEMAKRFIKAGEGFAEQALIQLGLRRPLSELEKISVAITRQLKVEPAKDSDVVHIRLRTPYPVAGELLLRKLLDAYLESHLVAHQAAGVQEFFTEQTRDFQQRLSQGGRQLLEFRLRHDLWSAEEQRRVLLDSRKVLQLEHEATERRMAALQAELNSIQMLEERVPATIELSRVERRNPAMDVLQDRWATLRTDQAVVSAAYTENSREVLSRREQLAVLGQSLDEIPKVVAYSTTHGVNPAHQELTRQRVLKSAELEGVRQQALTEQEQLAGLDDRLRALESAAAEFQQLDREFRLLEKNYILYSENLEKSRITDVMNHARISNLKVISPPRASKLPAGPGLKIVLLASALAGLALGSTLALFLELRHGT